MLTKASRASLDAAKTVLKEALQSRYLFPHSHVIYLFLQAFCAKDLNQLRFQYMQKPEFLSDTLILPSDLQIIEMASTDALDHINVMYAKSLWSIFIDAFEDRVIAHGGQKLKNFYAMKTYVDFLNAYTSVLNEAKDKDSIKKALDYLSKFKAAPILAMHLQNYNTFKQNADLKAKTIMPDGFEQNFLICFHPRQEDARNLALSASKTLTQLSKV